MQAKDYANRDALEAAIMIKTTEPKDETITGTVEELKLLALEHGMVVWGMSVVASDYEPIQQYERPSRGESHTFGINKRAPRV